MRNALTTESYSADQGLASHAEPLRPWSEAVQLESGRLGEQAQWFSVGDTRLCCFEFSRSVVIRGVTDAATLVLGDPGLRACGWTIREDEVLSLPPGRRFDLYVPAATSAAFMLGPAVEEALTTGNYPEADLLHRSSDPARRTLWNYVRQGAESAGVRPKLDENLRRSVTAAVAGGVASVVASVSDGTRGRAVRGALDFIENHAHGSLRLADLCAATGVGARTMEYGFREFYDISPMTYVKCLRLNRARRDLVRAGPTAPSVKSFAELWGFRHMGQFAKDYKSLFGENPSVTRVRSQDRV